MKSGTLLVATLIWAVLGCEKKDDADSRGPNPTGISQTQEYKLAAYHYGGIPPENDAVIGQFRTVLTSLDAKYPEDAKTIADKSIGAHQTYKHAGGRETVLAIMQGVDKAGGGGTYIDACDAYVAKLPKGRR